MRNAAKTAAGAFARAGGVFADCLDFDRGQRHDQRPTAGLFRDPRQRISATPRGAGRGFRDGFRDGFTAGFLAIGLAFAGRFGSGAARSCLVEYCAAVGRLAVVDLPVEVLRGAGALAALLPCDIARLAMSIPFHYDYMIFPA